VRIQSDKYVHREQFRNNKRGFGDREQVGNEVGSLLADEESTFSLQRAFSSEVMV
jgi:hypothetical protein